MDAERKRQQTQYAQERGQQQEQFLKEKKELERKLAFLQDNEREMDKELQDFQTGKARVLTPEDKESLIRASLNQADDEILRSFSRKDDLLHHLQKKK